MGLAQKLKLKAKISQKNKENLQEASRLAKRKEEFACAAKLLKRNIKQAFKTCEDAAKEGCTSADVGTTMGHSTIHELNINAVYNALVKEGFTVEKMWDSGIIRADDCSGNTAHYYLRVNW